MSRKLQLDVRYDNQWWRRLVNADDVNAGILQRGWDWALFDVAL